MEAEIEIITDFVKPAFQLGQCKLHKCENGSWKGNKLLFLKWFHIQKDEHESSK